LANQTRDPHHRLNVASGRMSASEKFPNDFVEWSNALAYSFLERRTYGTYLPNCLGEGVNHIPDFLHDIPESSQIISDAWDGSSLQELRTLLCFGTGLSFIDIALAHLSRDSRNKVTTISNSGNLPERHTQFPITPFTPTVEEVSTLPELREYLASSGDMWHEAVDGFRTITETMWQKFLRMSGQSFWQLTVHGGRVDVTALPLRLSIKSKRKSTPGG